jgi:CBS domain-containing protein
MALGSEGRQEQTLCTDQDNALIYTDVAEKEMTEVADYYLILSQLVVSGLERCGFPLCSGGIMASNPQWCQPMSQWIKLYRRWILDSAMTNQELLTSSIFFDYRAIHGDATLVQQMGQAITQFLPKNTGFLRQLALRSLELHTPLSFFNRLVVQKSGVHKNKLNIKLYGLMPLIDAVRVLSLEQGITATNTLERIDALINRAILPSGEGHDLKEAFNLLLLLQLRNHLGQLNNGQQPDNYLNPSELSLIQRSVLKTTFKAIEQLQSRIEIRYGISSLGTR